MIHLGFRLALRPPTKTGPTNPAFTLEVAVTLGGKATAVLGPSGAGKTSLLEVIAGLRKNAVGRVVVDQTTFLDSGERVRLPPERRKVGYVPQEPALFPHLDVRANVRYGLRNAIGADRLVDETIELLEIGPLVARFPRTLSGGEAQRVALARALVTKPRLLLLDEPLAALHSELKERILPYLMRVRDESKIPMLYVTHHAGEALALADEAVVLRAGRVEAKGPAREILTPKVLAPVHGEATFENIVDGVIMETNPEAGTAVLVPVGAGPSDSPTGELTLAVPGSSDLAVGQRATYRVASEDILLLRTKPDGISARNVLRGSVLDIEPSGRDAVVGVETSGLEWRVRLTPAAVRELELDPGREIWIAIKTHTFERLG
jgi:molybdate transport system ATP-binding protein